MSTTTSANKCITQQVSIKSIRDTGRVFKQAYATVENGVVVEISQTDAFARLLKVNGIVAAPLPEISTDRIQKLTELGIRYSTQNAKEEAFLAIHPTIYNRLDVTPAAYFIVANSTTVVTSVTIKDENGCDTLVTLHAFGYQDDTVYFALDDDTKLLPAVEKEELVALNIL